MPTARIWLRMLLALLLLGAPLQALAAVLPKLDAPPEGERWFTINMADERVGFAHLNITRSADGYLIYSEGSVKMRVMGFSREATSRESYLVGRDLALRSFTSDSRIDGKPMKVGGEVTPKGIKVQVTSTDGTSERSVKTKGTVYPPQALNILPLMKGPVTGKSYKIPVIDVESAKVKLVKVEVIGEETLPPATSAIHLRNNLYPMVDNDIWVDLKGNTLKESVRDDLVVTLAEDEATAKQQLANEALAKKEFAVNFGLIPVEPPIERPEQLKKLNIELAGIPAAMPLLQGKSQAATRLPDGKVVFGMPNPGFTPAPGEAPAAADLAPSRRIPSDAPEMVAKKGELLGDQKDPAQAVRVLVGWVAKEIKETTDDGQSALETLKSGKGNCQDHVRLYTTLARSAGIPTRFVSGLVYSPERGYLYHCWAESYLNGWVPVDPTFGEVPANVTHIKLVEGDSPDDMVLLAGVIGRLQAKVLEKSY